MFNNRSKSLFIANLLALAYIIYLSSYMGSSASEASGDAETIGTGIAILLVLPQLLLTILGLIFGIIAFFGRKVGLALTSAIIYATAAVTFFLYAAFLIPTIVLAFIGYTAQKKFNASK